MRNAIGRALEEIVDFLVGGLIEVLVPETHGVEGLRCAKADDVVHLPSERPAGLPRADRHRDHDLSRSFLAESRDGRAHGGTGCQPIVYEDDGAAAQVGESAIVAISSLAPLELLALARGDALEGLVVDAIGPQHLLVHDAHATARDRADTELLVPGESDLPHDEDVQRRVERVGKLERDGDAASWKPEDDEVRPASKT